MSRFDTQIETWWRYIDHILLFYLRSPLPYVEPTFDVDMTSLFASTTTRLNMYSAVEAVDEINIDAFIKFMMPAHDKISVNRLLEGISEIKSGEDIVFNHDKEVIHAAKEVYPKIEDAANLYMQKIMDTFPELSPIRAWMRIGSIEDPDSPIGKLTDTVRDPETIIGKLSGIFGNTELFNDRLEKMQCELFEIYNVLDLNSPTTRADLYFKGIEYITKKRESEIKDPDELEIFHHYKGIYDFLLELLKKYTEIGRPFIYDRMTHLMLCNNIRDVGYERIYPVFDRGADTTQRRWFTSKNNYTSSQIEDALNEACRIMRQTVEDPKGCKLMLYYPWQMTLIRYNDGGDTNECHY